MQYRVEAIRFNEIKVDPFLTPEYMEVRQFITSRPKRIEQFTDLISDFQFQEPLKILECEKGLLLVDDYDYYKALSSVCSQGSDRTIHCLVLSGVDYRQAKELTLRFQAIRGLESQEARIINLKVLVDASCSLQHIRQVYGVKKSKSAEGKQLERDYKLARCDLLFNRVLGISAEDKAQSIFDRVCQPQVRKATLSYRVALDLIPILLGGNEECVQEFDALYEKYIENLRQHHLFDDEASKPVYLWSKYRKEHVREIAAAVARRGEKTSYDLSILNGDPESWDQRWSISINEDTHEMTLPQMRVSLSKKSDANIKKIVDLHYRLEKLYFALGSYIKRIAPVEHGGPIRTQSSDIAPSLETKSNAPKFEDTSYFHLIRKSKNLSYCSREMLLKSIGLKAHYFGFDGYAPASISSYAEAHKLFEKWYKDEFLRRVELHNGGRESKHHLYETYASIRSFITFKSSDTADVLFADFIIDLFKKVFSDLDIKDDKKSQEMESLRKLDLQVRDSVVAKVRTALRKAGVSEDELMKAARELVLPDEDRLISSVSKLDHAVRSLVDANRAEE